MQKLRNQIYKPLSLTRFVVGSGVILFLTGVLLLVVRTAEADIRMARLNLYGAGWVLTAGWILKRIEDRQWPFLSQTANGGQCPQRVIANILVIGAAVVGAMIWRSYGPLSRDFSPPTGTAISRSNVAPAGDAAVPGRLWSRSK